MTVAALVLPVAADDDDGPEVLVPPGLPTMSEVCADPARSAVAAAVAVHLAGQLGLEDVAGDSLAALEACVDRLRAGRGAVPSEPVPVAQ